MRQARRSDLQRSLGRIVITALAPLALLVPLTIVGTGTAAASPAAGYTASLISTGADAFAVAVDPATNTAYVADLVANELSVINGSTNTVTATIALAGRPQGVAVDAATNTVYVSLQSGALEVVDGKTNTVTDIIALPAGSNPFGVAVDSTTGVVYVAELGASTVAVIDESANTVTATVSTGSGTSPREVAVDATSDVVWVADTTGNVLGISGASNTVTQTVSFVGSHVEGVDVDPGTDTVYAAVQNPPEVAVINGSTGAIDTTIALTTTDSPFSVAVDPAAGTVFASSNASISGSGTTLVIDEASNAITDTIERGGIQVAVNTTTGAAYVAAYIDQTNAVWVLTPSAVNAMSPVIKSTIASFTVGEAGSFTILGSAQPAATYSELGSLPSGVTLSTSGVLSGAPAAGTAGSYLIELTAGNGIPPDYSQAFTLVVNPAVPPAIITSSQATFTVGAANIFIVQATGTPAPTFTESGPLPTGVTLSSAGILSGTPAADATGSYPIQISATNAGGTATQAFTLTVALPPASSWQPAVLNDSDGAVDVYVVRSDENVWTDSQPAGGGAFTGWQQLSASGGFAGTPAVVQVSGIIELYARTTSGTLMGISQDSPGGAFGTWTQIGAASDVTGDPVALMASNGAVAIYATNSLGMVEGISQAAAFGPFGSWQSLSPAEGFTGRPAVLMTASGLVAIYARTTAGTVLATSQHVRFGPFDPWSLIGSATPFVAGDPVALIAGNGAVAIYATNSLGMVEGISQAAAFGPFGSWQALSPGDAFAGRPAVLMTSAGLVAMYARALGPPAPGVTPGTLLATSQHVRFGPFSPWSQLGTATDLISDPAALITAAGTVAIFATDSTGGVSWISQSAPFGPFGTWTQL